MFDTLAEFRRRLFERPLREVGYLLAGYLLIDIPVRAAEETVISWCREELAERFGITRPSIFAVASVLWHWVVPALGILLIMLLYHRGNMRHAPTTTTDSQALDISRPQDRDSFLPWFMVMAAVALLVIFERESSLSRLISELPVSGGEINSTEIVGGIKWVGLSNVPLALISKPDGDINVLEFSMFGISVSKDAIRLDEACINSGITKETKIMMVATRNGRVPLDYIEPIVYNTQINLVCGFGDGGMSSATFLRDWGIIKITIKYAGMSFERTFSGDQIRALFANMHPNPVPRRQ